MPLGSIFSQTSSVSRDVLKQPDSLWQHARDAGGIGRGDFPDRLAIEHLAALHADVPVKSLADFAQIAGQESLGFGDNHAQGRGADVQGHDRIAGLDAGDADIAVFWGEPSGQDSGSVHGADAAVFRV